MATVPTILTTLMQVAETSGTLPKFFHTQIQLSNMTVANRTKTIGVSDQVYLIYLNNYCTADYKSGSYKCRPGSTTCDVDYSTIKCAHNSSISFVFDPIRIFDPMQAFVGSTDRENSEKCQKDLQSFHGKFKNTCALIMTATILSGSVVVICLFLIFFPCIYPWFLPPVVIRAWIFLASITGLPVSIAFYALQIASGNALTGALDSCLDLSPPKVLVTQKYLTTLPPFQGISIACSIFFFLSAQYSIQYLCCGGCTRDRHAGGYTYWGGFDGGGGGAGTFDTSFVGESGGGCDGGGGGGGC